MHFFYINNKVTITLLLFHLRIISAKELIYKRLIINDDYTINEKMPRVMMSVLENCYPRELEMITIAGDFKNFGNWHKNFSSKLRIYRVGLSGSKAFERHRRLQNVYVLTERVVSKLYYPSNFFLVSSPSLMILKTLLKRMKNSVTWKASAIYYFVNEEPQSCNKVDDIFKEAWEMNIYNAAYVCFDESKYIQFFSFNPFKNAASKSWRFSHFTPGVNNNIKWPMAIFKFAHNSSNIKSSSYCPNPEFHKTHDLNNYPVILNAVHIPTVFELKNRTMRKLINSSLSDYKGPDVAMADIVWSHLEGQPVLEFTDDIGYISPNNQPSGAIANLLNSEFDIIPNKLSMDNFWRLQTFPHQIQKICAVTITRDRRPPPLHVILLDFQIFWRILLLGGVAVLALVYAVKIKPGKAFLEVLQRLLNMTSDFRPENSCFKRFVYIYIAFIFVFYNFQLNSSITSDRYNISNEKMPLSFTELFNAGYILQGPGKFINFLNNDIANYYVIAEVGECFTSIINGNNNIACIGDCKIMKNNIRNPKILINGPLHETYVTNIVREYWPLLTMVNQVIHTLVQAGIPVFLDRISFADIEKLEYERKEASRMYEELAHPVALEGVTFIYYSLAVGQFLALLIFFLEYYWNQCRTRKVTSKQLDKLMIIRNKSRK